uniref:Uncharacterized protein n=1 Tax=Arundo donax TaxID=35708 RepID=A0A0A9CAV9_ARUDO
MKGLQMQNTQVDKRGLSVANLLSDQLTR